MIQNNKKYKDIFTKVENTLREVSTYTSEEFDKCFEKFKNLDYKKMSDNDIFWAMVKVVFYSGMNAATVTKRLPAIEKHLYDFSKVKDFSEDEIDKFLRDPETIHNKRKLKACVANAKIYNEFLKNYGSFNGYLESFGPIDEDITIDRLRSDLQVKFHYLGGITVNHFLMDLGLNVLKPDRVICRIFTRLGLIKDENDLLGAIEVGKKMIKEVNQPIRYIDIIFVKYGQVGEEYPGLKDGICLEKSPKCNICGVKEYCNYYKSHQLSA